jgi:sigma-B regulation protein RsbU (phosphoserine phosphatase)
MSADRGRPLVSDAAAPRAPGHVRRRDRVARVLFTTLPGRAVVVGLAVRAAIAVLAGLTTIPAFLGVVDTVAGLAVLAGGGFFLIKGISIAQRRLLWRVRRKLIISYIFVGVVPAILITAFFLLGGLLLLYNFSAYLVQTELRGLSERARAVAQGVASQGASRARLRDLVTRGQRAIAADVPGASIAVVPFERTCTGAGASPSGDGMVTAGAWAHVAAPAALPDWLDCEGFAGLIALTHGSTETARVAPMSGGAGVVGPHVDVVARGIAFPDADEPRFAVVVDLPVDLAVANRLRRDTGVHVTGFQAIGDRALPIDARASFPGVDLDQPDAASSGLLSLPDSLVEHRDWRSGQSGPLRVTTELRIAELYNRISSQGPFGQDFGRTLLFVLLVIGALFLIIQAAALAVGLALARSITGSVHELFTGTEKVREGDFTHRMAVRAADQLGELAESFNSMTDSIETLMQQAAEKERLEEELRIAHEIQMSLLPQGPLVAPGLSVTAVCVPAREVGGDYYDFLRLDEDRVAVIIADVSGKGTSAALYMAELKGLILSLSEIHPSPRALLIAANRIISAHLDARSFITMTYAVIDLRSRTMTYARAGHTPLMRLSGAERRSVDILAPGGLVLGLQIDDGQMFERVLQEETMALHANDVCVFFTDGITEAMNTGDDCFGEHRLGQLIEAYAHLSSDEIRARVFDELALFVGSAPQHDDMTMILLKVEGSARADLVDTLDERQAVGVAAHRSQHRA